MVEKCIDNDDQDVVIVENGDEEVEKVAIETVDESADDNVEMVADVAEEEDNGKEGNLFDILPILRIIYH